MLFLLVLLVCGNAIEGLPVETLEKHKVKANSDINYLQRFGYLDKTDMDNYGNLRNEAVLTNALKEMQQLAHIPVTGVLDTATRQMMQTPRCGLPDVHHDSGGRRSQSYAMNPGRRGWETKRLTWSLQSRGPQGFTTGQVRSELYRAFGVWANSTTFTFQEVNSDTADILVAFRRGKHKEDPQDFDGRGYVLAHAFFPGSGIGGDAHFDDDESWLVSGQGRDDAVDLFTVAVHEFGHSLGLGHSTDKDAVMYSYFTKMRTIDVLPDDDRRGIEALYGTSEAVTPSHKPESTRTPLWYNTVSGRDHTRPQPTTRRPSYVTQTPRNEPPALPPRQQPPSRKPPPPRQPPSVTDIPDKCNTTNYDAVALLRGEIFIFKEWYMWRKRNSEILPASSISRFWTGLPENLTHVDAVYERLDGKIVFFVGKQYYVFNGRQLERDYPRPITALGLPDQLDRVDAAFVWNKNKKTYFFSGYKFWLFVDGVQRVARLDYPREIAGSWKGLYGDIDAVLAGNDRKTYFFKGNRYWKYDDDRMEVENKQPMFSAAFFMDCPQ